MLNWDIIWCNLLHYPCQSQLYDYTMSFYFFHSGQKDFIPTNIQLDRFPEYLLYDSCKRCQRAFWNNSLSLLSSFFEALLWMLCLLILIIPECYSKLINKRQTWQTPTDTSLNDDCTLGFCWIVFSLYCISSWFSMLHLVECLLKFEDWRYGRCYCWLYFSYWRWIWKTVLPLQNLACSSPINSSSACDLYLLLITLSTPLLMWIRLIVL